MVSAPHLIMNFILEDNSSFLGFGPYLDVDFILKLISILGLIILENVVKIIWLHGIGSSQSFTWFNNKNES